MIADTSPLQLESNEPAVLDRFADSSETHVPDRTDRVTPLTRGASARLAHLSDSELLARTQGLVGKSNQILAALLEHLAEVQARGLHRERACARPLHLLHL
jgi:hypothetical protein